MRNRRLSVVAVITVAATAASAYAQTTNAQDLSVYNSDGNVHVILDVTGDYQ